MNIRHTTNDDIDTISDIVRRAFGSEEEVTLVKNLLADPSANPALSLLAAIDGCDVGHILFSPASVSA